MLPDEMRLEIFEKLIEMKEWTTLRKAAQVSCAWNAEIEKFWRLYCKKMDLLQDEDLWAKKGKSWKWLCECLSTAVDAKDIHKPSPAATNAAGDSNNAGSVANSGNSPQEDPMDIEKEAPKKTGCGWAVLPAPNNQTCRYEGEWLDGKRNGVGKISWDNGDRYLGDWSQDSKQGHGFMRWENGDFYEGPWFSDMRHGDSVSYSYANGGRYEGTYTNDERHGAGRFYWPDGDYYEGVWQSGGRSGNGVLVLAKEGKRVEQQWHEDPSSNYSAELPAKYPRSMNTGDGEGEGAVNFPPMQS